MTGALLGLLLLATPPADKPPGWVRAFITFGGALGGSAAGLIAGANIGNDVGGPDGAITGMTWTVPLLAAPGALLGAVIPGAGDDDPPSVGGAALGAGLGAAVALGAGLIVAERDADTGALTSSLLGLVLTTTGAVLGARW
ncbi:MAG: hypothetical protein H6706_30020 [Myxococcales bacterium]|nr:hypothetical protein [Myxococcales bacterium]